MSKGKIVAIVIGVLLLGLSVAYFGIAVSYKNDEIAVREAITAQVDQNKNTFDVMYKVIAQKAQVNEKYASDFKDVYIKSMTARYSDKNPAMMWIKENVPNLDPSIYKELGNTIESQREKFAMEQKRLIGLKEQHNKMLKQFPSSWFLGGIQPIEIDIVTSGKTKEVFVTGEDNDIKLFK